METRKKESKMLQYLIRKNPNVHDIAPLEFIHLIKEDVEGEGAQVKFLGIIHPVYGFSYLQVCAAVHIDLLKKAIEMGEKQGNLNLEVGNLWNYTPLICAVHYLQSEAVDLLLSKGARCNVRTKKDDRTDMIEGGTALHLLARLACYDENYSNNYGYFNRKYFYDECIKIAIALIKHGIDASVQAKGSSYSYNFQGKKILGRGTFLEVALACKFYSFIKEVIPHLNEEKNKLSSQQAREEIELLIQESLVIDKFEIPLEKNKQLAKAVQAGKSEEVMALLESGAYVNEEITEGNYKGRSLWWAALALKHTDIYEQLKNNGASLPSTLVELEHIREHCPTYFSKLKQNNLDLRNDQLVATLAFLDNYKEHELFPFDAYRILILHLVYENLLTRYDNEETILHKAVRMDRPEIISICGDAGIDFEAVNTSKQTALQLAVSLQKKEIASLLIIHGAVTDLDLYPKLLSLGVNHVECHQKKMTMLEEKENRISSGQKVLQMQLPSLVMGLVNMHDKQQQMVNQQREMLEQQQKIITSQKLELMLLSEQMVNIQREVAKLKQAGNSSQETSKPENGKKSGMGLF